MARACVCMCVYVHVFNFNRDLSDNQIAEIKEEFLNGAQTGTGKIEM